MEDPLHAVTAYAYDESSNRTTQTDANHHATSFEYDELNRVTAMVYPDQARETYHYDENGNRTEQVDPKGQHILSAYDEINRETLRTYPATGAGGELQSIATAYDANNNPLAITETFAAPSNPAVTTKTYDDFDRLTTVTDRYGKKLLYVYDANGNRKSLQDPDAKVTRYDYDALNRLTAVTLPGAGVTNYDYYRDSRLKQVTYPNGTVAANTYDAATRVATITNRQAVTVVSSYAYQYDKNGNRTQQIEVNGGAPETTTYQFDASDRLAQVSYPDKTVAYTYDAEGNRTAEQVRDAQNALTADKTSTYDVRDRLISTADALNATAGVTYTFDANGNRISRQQGATTTDLIYDIRDQLTEVRTNSTLLETYAYDYRGMRVRKAGSGALLRYVYDDKSVLLQTDDFGNTISKYDYGPDRLLALTNATQGRQYYLFDALGSVAGLMTPGGGIQARYQYDAWGNDRGRAGTSANVFGFTGHERDTATGLYYFKARFYDPETGLFLTEDPVAGKAETPPSLHRYLYAYANPTVYWDLTGRTSVVFHDSTGKMEDVPDDGRAMYAELMKAEGMTRQLAEHYVDEAGLGADIGLDRSRQLLDYNFIASAGEAAVKYGLGYWSAFGAALAAPLLLPEAPA